MKRIRLAAALLAVFMTVASQAAAVRYSDVPDTDKEYVAISRWSDEKIMLGDDGLFRPDDGVTRGEMAVILDRFMVYRTKSENTFQDLGDAYYTDAVLKLDAAGIIEGSDGYCRPLDMVSRQEAAVMLCRALGIQNGQAPAFEDQGSIAPWAESAVAAVTSLGYFEAENNAFEPSRAITRAELAGALNRAVSAWYTQRGTYSHNEASNVIVAGQNVTLKDMVIGGNLIISEGAGSGTVKLQDVTVKGSVIVRGGRLNCAGETSLPNVVMQKLGDSTALIIDGEAASAASVVLAEGSKDVTLTGKINKVELAAKDCKMKLKNARTGTVLVDAAGAELTLDGHSSVSTLTIKQSDAKLEAENGAVIGTLKNEGNADAENLKAAMLGTDEGIRVIRQSGTYTGRNYTNLVIEDGIKGEVKLVDVKVTGRLTVNSPVEFSDGCRIGTLETRSDIKLIDSDVEDMILAEDAAAIEVEGRSSIREFTVSESVSKKPVVHLTSFEGKTPEVSRVFARSKLGVEFTGTGRMQEIWTANYDETRVSPSIKDSKGNTMSAETGLNNYKVTFDPSGASGEVTVVVTKDGEEIAPSADLTYQLDAGFYQYTASAEGYSELTGTIEVSQADALRRRSRSIQLQFKKIPSQSSSPGTINSAKGVISSVSVTAASSPKVGTVLTAHAVTGDNVELSYRWMRGTQIISTESTYTITSDDLSRVLTVMVIPNGQTSAAKVASYIVP